MSHLTPLPRGVPHGVLQPLPGVRDEPQPGSYLYGLTTNEQAAFEILVGRLDEHLRLFRVMVDGRPRAVIAHVLAHPVPVVTPLALLLDATAFEELLAE